MSLSLEMAKRIRAMRFDNLPSEAVHWAKVAILDTVGVAIQGGRDDSTRIASKVLLTSAPGSSLLFGQDKRTTALDAARINGVAAHALDFDDGNNTFAGHPSAPILPALFALADESKISGRDFIAAFVAGYEAECRISLGVNLYQYLRGWHTTTTIGVLGAAAAAAHLLKLDEQQISRALAIAASTASGIRSNVGTMTKPLHNGQATHNGLYAALLAREGYTASDLAFEGEMGYFECYNGKGNFDASRIMPGWGEPLSIIQPGPGIKVYPCCASTHPAIDCAIIIANQHNLKPEDIAKVESYTHTRRLFHTNRPDPKTSVDAKFSVQYSVARGLVDRKVVVEHFAGNAYEDARTQAVMKKVMAAAYTTEQFPADNHFGAEVRVTLNNGKVLTHKVDQPYGRTTSAALPPEMLRAKFENCINGIVHESNVPGLYDALTKLDSLNDVRDVTAMISSRPVRKAAAAA